MTRRTTRQLKAVLLVTASVLSGWAAGPAYADEAAAATRANPAKALFGDVHMHTSYSFDAFTFKTTATPDDAYKFAQGEPRKHPAGGTYQLKRPLDFMAVTDHSEFMGVMRAMGDPNSPLSKAPIAKEATDPSVAVSVNAFRKIVEARRAGKFEDLVGPAANSAQVIKDAWATMIDTANKNYKPGKFTTLIGYEWSSTPGGKNLHRNVIFRTDKAPNPFTSNQSDDPEDLWAYLENARRNGYMAIAIPHNSNLSDGAMFGATDFKGRPMTAEYMRRRISAEPVAEITQVKGQSEVHPSLAPNDEFANFELLETYVASNKPVTNFAGSYVRDAMKLGLTMQETEGANPYKFGVIGSSDSHSGIVPASEANYSGKVGVVDGTPSNRLDCTYCTGSDYRKFGSAGLAAVWARENTREEVFDAFARKETFATTGPRILVRFFGGYDMGAVDPKAKGWVDAAYKAGVPMGGVLGASDPAKAPEFVVWALKDPDGANLDRIQIVKMWSKDGKPQEKVYDVVWSGARKIDPATGKLPPVGDTVNVAAATYQNTIGTGELSARWKDPDFDPNVNAAYYARVIEIPTPRWSTYDAKTLGREPMKDLPAKLQERAFTSPIWRDGGKKA